MDPARCSCSKETILHLPPVGKLLEKHPSTTSQLLRHPPKGHPSLCLVKLLIIRWHVHLMIKRLHHKHERQRRTN